MVWWGNVASHKSIQGNCSILQGLILTRSLFWQSRFPVRCEEWSSRKAACEVWGFNNWKCSLEQGFFRRSYLRITSFCQRVLITTGEQKSQLQCFLPTSRNYLWVMTELALTSFLKTVTRKERSRRGVPTDCSRFTAHWIAIRSCGT